MMSINKKTISTSFIWAIGERVTTQGVLFVITIVLARILNPQEYGIIALLLVFIAVADVLVTNGLGEALIQRQNCSQLDFNTIFICGLLGSLVLYAVLFFSAPFIGQFYNDDNMPLLLRILALRIPLSSLNAIQRSYMQKNFLFKKLFYSATLSSIVSGLVAIVFAYIGFGVYALIIQQILSVLLNAILSAIFAKWHPGFSFSRTSMKEILPLGSQFAGASFVNVLYTEGRSLIIGKFYSASDLAFYNRGNQFPSLIINVINTPISNVMLPVMASVNDNQDKLRDVTRQAMVVSSFVVFPLMAVLALCARNLVLVLLTDKWIDSVVFLQIACIFYLFQPLQTMNWQAIKASGRGDLCLKLEIIKKIIGFGLLFISSPFGAYAIAWASALFGLISMAINMIPNGKLLNYSIKCQLKDMIPAAFCSMLACVSMALMAMIDAGPVFELVLQIFSGIVTYCGVSLVFNKRAIDFMKKFIKKDSEVSELSEA